MSVTNNVLLKGVVLSGAVSMTAVLSGCGGGGSHDGPVSESDRIGASLTSVQAELSTESLEGLWLMYAEESESSDYNSADGERSSERRRNIKRKEFITANVENSNEVVLSSCHGRWLATIDIEASSIDYMDSDSERVLSVTDNLKMSFNYEAVEDDSEGNYRYVEVDKGNLWLYKVSDSSETPIGELILGEANSDVDCFETEAESWTYTGVVGGEAESRDGSREGVYIVGSTELDMWKYEGNGISARDSGGVYIEVDGDEYMEDEATSFNVTEISPLHYNFSYVLNSSNPEVVGSVTIGDTVTGE